MNDHMNKNLMNQSRLNAVGSWAQLFKGQLALTQG